MKMTVSFDVSGPEEFARAHQALAQAGIGQAPHFQPAPVHPHQQQQYAPYAPPAPVHQPYLPSAPVQHPQQYAPPAAPVQQQHQQQYAPPAPPAPQPAVVEGWNPAAVAPPQPVPVVDVAPTPKQRGRRKGDAPASGDHAITAIAKLAAELISVSGGNPNNYASLLQHWSKNLGMTLRQPADIPEERRADFIADLEKSIAYHTQLKASEGVR